MESRAFAYSQTMEKSISKADPRRSSLCLLLATFLWGSAVVAMDEGLRFLSPFSFNALRCALGSAFLLVVWLVSRRRKKDALAPSEVKADRRRAVRGGLLLGCLLFVCLSLQQFSLVYTSVGKTAFLTTLYVVLVPLVGLFRGKRPAFKVWIGVGLSVCGVYLMSLGSADGLNLGDALALVCALLFTVYILVVDRLAHTSELLLLSLLQQLTRCLLSALAALLFEDLSAQQPLQSLLPLLYAGILASGVAYTLELIAQRGLEPVTAGILFTTEAVFAALCGLLLQGEWFTLRELIGAVLLLVAVLLARLPARKKRPKTDA